MTDIQYSIDPVDEKPDSNRSKWKSKYAPIIEAFLESGHDLVRVENTGKEPYYLCQYLTKV